VFDSPGSNVVLEVLDKKVNDIDDEVALLHELKDIVLEFIRQIKDADFSNDGDVKLLYEKAKDIEAQLVNVDYNGNKSAREQQTNVNRLLEVTGKLEKSPDVVRKLPHFYVMFHLSDPIEAYELYHKAFGVEKVSEDYPGGAPHIGIEINSFFILLKPNVDGVAHGGCGVRVASEQELRRVYDILTQEAKDYSLHLDWGWTPLAAQITDRYGVGWLLCV
jgi:hypothetical protein